MQVPEGWKYKRIGKIAELQRGFDLPLRERIEGNIPIVSSGGVSGYHNEAKVDPPGVVTGRYGTIGQVFFLKEAFWPLNTSLWVKNFFGNDPHFIYYFFNRIDFQRYSDKTGVPGINRNDIHAIKALLPPLAEQEKIAEILSTWDHAIEQTEHLKANAETHKQALMQQLLTGKKRFPEFEGEWEEVKIGSFIKESRVPSIDNSPTNRLTVRLHLKGVEAREVRGTEAVNSTGHYIRRAGQFIYGRQNFHNGAIGIIPEELDFFESSQDIPCFDFKNHCVSSWFFHFCSQESFYKRMEHYTTGTGSKRLHPNDFMKIKIKLPSLEEQQKIAAVLNRADREIELLAQKLDHLKTEKRALMQQLLTGKRRVKVDG